MLESVDEFDDIIVNTDADTILETGEDMFDIKVSERPEHLLGEPTTRNIIRYEVDRTSADTYVQTYCTNPLLKANTVSDAIERFRETEENDSLFTVTRHQKRLYNEDMEPINHDPLKIQRTQDVEPVYEDNSSIYIYRSDIFQNPDHTIGAVPIGTDPMVYEMNEIEALDIDNKADFEMAEYFHRQWNGDK
jgi:N-acylneuraminate cytidylyltransferase